ncbi:MAG: LuxR C-terminal-related transcriptional regulator [Desulfobacterales bacterium]|nr:LuxR C-terminal-related transcriptional regulator [Desulfobacterales bacterium]
MKQQKQIDDSEPDAFIHIIGNNMLQNELLLSFLKDKIGLKGKCLSNLESEHLSGGSESEQSKFLLIDCKSIDMKSFWPEINSLKESNPPQCFIALCNVDSKAKIEKMAMGHGIEGVFYDSDPPQTIPKGIVAILNGDLWYSRKTMTTFLLEPKSLANSPENRYANDLLTSREKEVLTLIALGHISRKIADTLCISSHTVKTHIYNIYNKINVTNRLQATLWAAKYL